MEPKEQGYWQPNQPGVEPARAVVPVGDPVQPGPQGMTPQQPVEPAAADIDAEAPLLPGVTWEASEFVHREKDTIWFVIVGIVGVVLALLALFLLKSITFTVLIVVMVVALIFLAIRPPRLIHYQLSGQGIQINEAHYDFQNFRAFGVVQEDAMYYITLLPVKRYYPAINLYFPQEHGEQIVDMIGAHVPMQTVKPDAIDRMTRYLRF